MRRPHRDFGILLLVLIVAALAMPDKPAPLEGALSMGGIYLGAPAKHQGELIGVTTHQGTYISYDGPGEGATGVCFGPLELDGIQILPAHTTRSMCEDTLGAPLVEDSKYLLWSLADGFVLFVKNGKFLQLSDRPRAVPYPVLGKANFEDASRNPQNANEAHQGQ